MLLVAMPFAPSSVGWACWMGLARLHGNPSTPKPGEKARTALDDHRETNSLTAPKIPQSSCLVVAEG